MSQIFSNVALHRVRLILLPAFFSFSLFSFGQKTVNDGYQTIAIPPSSYDSNKIPLPGRMQNPSAELWETVQLLGAFPEGVAATKLPEITVRNISRPALEVFLPDTTIRTGAAMIVAPGGGFFESSIEREGYTIAQWLIKRGITAFVLKYRQSPTPPDQNDYAEYRRHLKVVRWITENGSTTGEILDDKLKLAVNAALEDGLEAVRYVRVHSRQWGVSEHRIGFMGFSAGAITTINVAIHADSDSRPDLIAPIYGAMLKGWKVNSTMPPSFIATADDDPMVPSITNTTFYSALKSAGVKAELHVFKTGGHGFGMLQQGKDSDQWPILFDTWLKEYGFEK